MLKQESVGLRFSCNTVSSFIAFLCFEDDICSLASCCAAKGIWTWDGTIMRGLSEKEMNGKQVIRKQWHGMFVVGWKAALMRFTVRTAVLTGVYNGRHALRACSSLSGRHVWCALISTYRIQTVPFIGVWTSNACELSFTTRSLTCFYFSAVHANTHSRSAYPPFIRHSHTGTDGALSFWDI